MVDSATMTSPPVAVVDALNSLLEAEQSSVFRFMGEGSPYLSRASGGHAPAARDPVGAQGARGGAPQSGAGSNRGIEMNLEWLVREGSNKKTVSHPEVLRRISRRYAMGREILRYAQNDGSERAVYHPSSTSTVTTASGTGNSTTTSA